MKRVMITGSGMLANAMFNAASGFGYEPLLYPRETLDITDRDQVLRAITSLRPDTILHTAALTKVNVCEQQPEDAWRTNRDGTRNVTEAAEQAMSRLVYFSTDYVFDGSREWPWTEDDEPRPINVYGASKLAGEKYIRNYFRGHVIRTSGLFGPCTAGREERNFFRAITAKLLTTGAPIPVVADQRTAVTDATHLAAITFTLMLEGLPALSHITSSGSDTWYGWACLAAEACGQKEGRLQAVSAAKLDLGAPRPAYSVLTSNNTSLKTLMVMHPARPAVQLYVGSIKDQFRGLKH
jgi:dTDP-4-dehydrorhamnose reductase